MIPPVLARAEVTPCYCTCEERRVATSALLSYNAFLHSKNRVLPWSSLSRIASLTSLSSIAVQGLH